MMHRELVCMMASAIMAGQKDASSPEIAAKACVGLAVAILKEVNEIAEYLEEEHKARQAAELANVRAENDTKAAAAEAEEKARVAAQKAEDDAIREAADKVATEAMAASGTRGDGAKFAETEAAAPAPESSGEDPEG